MTEWLMNYDQPMILLGLFGMIVCGIITGVDANTRSESSADSYSYQAAYKRTPKAIASFIACASLFATGWAIPNPTQGPITFQSAYEDCMPAGAVSSEDRASCINVAKEIMAHQVKK